MEVKVILMGANLHIILLFIRPLALLLFKNRFWIFLVLPGYCYSLTCQSFIDFPESRWEAHPYLVDVEHAKSFLKVGNPMEKVALQTLLGTVELPRFRVQAILEVIRLIREKGSEFKLTSAILDEERGVISAAVDPRVAEKYRFSVRYLRELNSLPVDGRPLTGFEKEVSEPISGDFSEAPNVTLFRSKRDQAIDDWMFSEVAGPDGDWLYRTELYNQKRESGEALGHSLIDREGGYSISMNEVLLRSSIVRSALESDSDYKKLNEFEKDELVVFLAVYPEFWNLRYRLDSVGVQLGKYEVLGGDVFRSEVKSLFFSGLGVDASLLIERTVRKSGLSKVYNARIRLQGELFEEAPLSEGHEVIRSEVEGVISEAFERSSEGNPNINVDLRRGEVGAFDDWRIKILDSATGRPADLDHLLELASNLSDVP